jgi:hypothetical protein
MMEAADHGGLDDPALVTPLHRSWLWRILAERKMCSGAVIVLREQGQSSTWSASCSILQIQPATMRSNGLRRTP